MESNTQQQATDQAVKQAGELAKGLMPLVGNLRGIMNHLQNQLPPEQRAEIEKQGLDKQFKETLKELDSVQNKLFNIKL